MTGIADDAAFGEIAGLETSAGRHGACRSEDLNAWRIEHNALDMAAARVIPISPVSPVSPVASVDAASAGGTVSQDDVLGFCRRLAPHDVAGHRKVRLGGENDGGYVFIDDFSEVNIVISCGISTM